MNPEEFVEVIKLVVVNGSVKGMESNLTKPPGRKPAQNLVEMSEWFNNLNRKDKDMLLRIIRESAEMSIFGFFCVLDGVTAIENGDRKGKLNLYYEKEGSQQLLNDFEGEFLHDLFNAV